MGVGTNLKEILRDKKMTIKQLSELADIPVNTLYSITKRDSERVDKVIVKRIAAALGVHPMDLMEQRDYAPEAIERAAKVFFQQDQYDKETIDRALEVLLHAKPQEVVWVNPQTRITTALGKLNDAGMEKAADAVETIAEVPRYQAPQRPSQRASPAPEGKDTTPAPEGSEGPQEGK